VQNALDFADQLASEDGVQDKFQEGLASGDETYVKLKREIPVRLLYHTAFLGTEGRLHFVADAYDWDNDVATALGYPSKAPSKRTVKAEDVGP
jgi:murein L,D-transpeptidase YcbB/YkuD